MKTAKKMGRPKSDNPRNIRLEIRLDKQENEILEECTKSLSLTKTEVLMRGLKEIYSQMKK